MIITHASTANVKLSRSNVAFNGKLNSGIQHTTAENVVRTFSKLPDSISKPIEFVGKSLNRPTNFLIAMTVILGARYLKARGEDEKREILTRDLAGIISVFYGTPIIKSILGNIIPKQTGFSFKEKQPETSLAKKALSFFRNGPNWINADQCNDWYSINPKSNAIFKGFCENLNEQGANLKKIFSKFDSEGKKLLNSVLGKPLKEIANNKEFLDKLAKSTSLDDIKSLETILKDSKNNPILKNAKFIKALPDFLGVAITVGLLGLLLPWYNIYCTNKKYAKKHEQQEKESHVTANKQNTNLQFNQKINKPITEVQKQLFSKFMN